MTFINDDEVEEVGRIVAKVGDGVTSVVLSSHEGLENGEEDAAVFRDSALLANFIGFNANTSVIRESGKSEFGLVGENVAIGKKEDAGAASRLATEVPPALK